jgi:hypothetical protein
LGNPAKLDDALSDDIDITAHVDEDFVEQLMQGDKVWPLHIPVRLFGLHHEVDGVCQALLK